MAAEINTQWWVIRLFFEGKRFPVVYERWAKDEVDARAVGRAFAATLHKDRVLERVIVQKSHR